MRSLPLAAVLALLVVTSGCAGTVRNADLGAVLGDGAPGPAPTPGPAPEPLTDLSAAERAALPPGVSADGVDERALFGAHLAGYENASFTTSFSVRYYYGDELTRHQVRKYRTDGRAFRSVQTGHLGNLHNRTYYGGGGGRIYTRDVHTDGDLQYGSLSDGPTPANGLRTPVLSTLVPYLQLRLTDVRTVDGERLFELSAVGAKSDPSGESDLVKPDHRRNLAATVLVDAAGRIRSFSFDSVAVGGPGTLSREMLSFSVSDVGSTTVAEPAWVDAPTTAEGAPTVRPDFDVSWHNETVLALTVETGRVPAGSLVLATYGGAQIERPLVEEDVLYVYGKDRGGIRVTRDPTTIPGTYGAKLPRMPPSISVVRLDHRPYWQFNTTDR